MPGKERALRSFEEGSSEGGARWLSAVPMPEHGLAFDRLTFRDAVALRMGRVPDGLPDVCPSCSKGEPFTLSHALKCHNGGWVKMRHTEVIGAWRGCSRRLTGAGA